MSKAKYEPPPQPPPPPPPPPPGRANGGEGGEEEELLEEVTGPRPSTMGSAKPASTRDTLQQRRPASSAGAGGGITSRHFRDPMEASSDRICRALNERHSAGMLLIAWHLCKRKETILAQMMQVDRLGFWVRCHFHGARYSEERVQFPCGPIDRALQLYEYIRMDLVAASSKANWPAGPLPRIVVAVYFLIWLIWYESHGGEDLSFLPNHWAEHLPDRQHLHYGFLVLIVGHVVISSVCCWVLFSRLKLELPRSAAPSWFASCFLLGYPAWCQILALKRARTQGILRKL